MDDMQTFERRVATEVVRAMGPSGPVDDAAIFTAITTTESPTWRFQSMFSVTKFVVAGAIVALFGGFPLVGQLARPTALPGAAPEMPGTVSATGSLAQPRWGHSATLLPDGRVLIVGGSEDFVGDPPMGTDTAEIWDPDTGAFSPAGSLAWPRGGGHTATLLADGRVLVVGGFSAEAAEIWDPATGTFSPGGVPAVHRYDHTATLLPDGRVLVVGGQDASTSMLLDTETEILSRTRVDSAEVWDPATGTFGPAGTHASHFWHTTTVLPDGRVLVVGSSPSRARLPASAEIWDPATGTFSPAGADALDLGWHHATLLSDGRVLVVDGEEGASATVWDPATGAFGPAGAPSISFVTSTTLLPDNRVLAIGSDSHRSDEPDPTVAEVWDPRTNTFSPAGSLPAAALNYYSDAALPDGRVLIAGGCIGDHCGGGALDSVVVWDPALDTFIDAGSLAEARTFLSSTTLPDGRVLVVGGLKEGRAVTSAEVWAPSSK